MKKLIIWAMLMFGFCSGMKAQEMAMRILVVDEWNRPLQGVAMHINGNDKETFLSDKEGVIECQVAKGAELSFIKYNQLQRKVTAAGTVMTVKLDKKNRIFDLGYDERVTKENTSAAIDGVSVEDMKVSGEISPLNTLYGLISGLGVYHSKSLLWDSSPAINVRGRGSYQGNGVLVLGFDFHNRWKHLLRLRHTPRQDSETMDLIQQRGIRERAFQL